MIKLVNQILKPLSDAPLQAYLDNRVQLFDIIEYILSQTGPASVCISTFSTSEEFLRRIFNLRKKGLITSAVMLADLKASRKTVNLYKLIVNVFDYVYLAENHSKVILIHNDKWCVSICTSQNQTRGNRTESGMISTSPEIFFNLQGQFSDIVNNHAILLNGLFNPTTSTGERTGGIPDTHQ